MINELKWELKKAICSWKYSACVLLGLVITYLIIPEFLAVYVSIGLVVSCVVLMYLPMYNVMLLLKQPGFVLEKQRGVSEYIRLAAKLLVNTFISAFMLLYANVANLSSRYFDEAGRVGFFYEPNVPLGQAWFEMAIFYPIIFLCIYYWAGKVSKRSHGILSWFLCIMVGGMFTTLQLNVWLIISIELLVLVLLYYMLGRWLKQAKEPYI